MKVMSMISLSNRRSGHCLTPTHTYTERAEAASSWERCDASRDLESGTNLWVAAKAFDTTSLCIVLDMSP
jgi:hypothetical protein